MWRLIVCLIVTVSATAGWGNCTGPSTFDALPAADQMALKQSAEEVPHASGLLWQVEKNGVTSVLVGTLHFPDPRLNAIRTRVAPLMRETKNLFLEMTLADEGKFQKRLTSDSSLFLINEGPSLIDRLGEENWEQVTTALEPLGLPGFSVSRYQPWFLGLNLSTPLCVLQAAQSGRLGLDRRLEQEAVALGLPTRSLDTVDGIISALASDPLDVQVTQLEDAIEAGLLGQDPDPQTIIDLYFKEQTQLIWTYESFKARNTATQSGMDADKVIAHLQKVEQDLVTSRNHSWMTVLTEELARAPSTVAVGALHLPGENGLLSLLMAEGFTVSRLELTP
ncbi:TraB/GumN family protein [uncultured Shimia sp.]|uniref:TraB/GumN family protein n=1 Tax=uncultured Shimia sp. TaxID=573152 RepID=UPI00260967B6|nr:TraB/GumN family protein [uncultured Shimia sp.]